MNKNGIEKGLQEIGAHMTRVADEEIRAIFIADNVEIGFDLKGIYISTNYGTYYPLVGFNCKGASIEKQELGNIEVIIKL